jgi:Fur family zinc uptake transcriptional regulator
MDSIGFETHDHSACISDSVAAVESYCRAEGLQLTPVRRRVLEILLEQHHALGAYDILDRLRADGFGSQPPVAYRALDFLVKHGFAHRIEKLNAFVACTQPTEEHTPAFLICRNCDAVAEGAAQLGRGSLARLADEAGFEIERIVVEAEGLCPKCRGTAPRQ